jgi:hypothetical protein
MGQTTLDNVPGVCFRPDKFLLPYLEDKAANPPMKLYCKICNDGILGYQGDLVLMPIEHFSYKSRCRKLASELFIAMCNKVCCNHKSDEVGLEPSFFLDVEFTKDQRKMLSCPTPRDIQIGVIISQIFGNKATTKIAMRRVDIMTGNIDWMLTEERERVGTADQKN